MLEPIMLGCFAMLCGISLLIGLIAIPKLGTMIELLKKIEESTRYPLMNLIAKAKDWEER